MNGEWLESLVLGDVLRSRAETHRDAAFLKFRDGELTFAEVDTAADRYANGLAAEGVGRGDHVAVMLPNCAEFVPVIVALARLGAVAVPVNTAYRGELLRHVLDSADVSTLLVDAEYTDRLPPVLPEVPDPIRVIVRGPEPSLDLLGDGAIPMSRLLAYGADPVNDGARFSDLQAIMYTSGTTGRSKGAMVPHALALACAYDSLDFLDRWGKTTYCPLPLFHAAGLWDGVFSSLLSGTPDRHRRAVQRLAVLGRRAPLRRADRDERVRDDPDPAQRTTGAAGPRPPPRNVLHGQVRAGRAAARTLRRAVGRDLHQHRGRHRHRQPVRAVARRLDGAGPRRAVRRRRRRRGRPRGRPRASRASSWCGPSSRS